MPQDNDRLMERLICLLPNDPDEPWEKMSDRYNSGLWDIYPDTQVCGIGENDTIIVDGFKGAFIQWSMFSTVQTMHRATLWRKAITIGTGLTPILLFLGILLLATGDSSSGGADSPYAQDNPMEGMVIAGAVLVAVSLAILLAAPLYLPYFYSGKLYEAEPCLFGIEGYIPLPAVEELLFGFRLGRLKWSPYGSPLSRHRHKEGYPERLSETDTESRPLLPRSNERTAQGFVWTYPVEAVDPCSSCASCNDRARTNTCRHEDFLSLEAKTRRPYGEMKVCHLLPSFLRDKGPSPLPTHSRRQKESDVSLPATDIHAHRHLFYDGHPFRGPPAARGANDWRLRGRHEARAGLLVRRDHGHDVQGDGAPGPHADGRQDAFPPACPFGAEEPAQAE